MKESMNNHPSIELCFRFILVIAFLGFNSCRTRNKTSFFERPLQDMVSHTLLDTVGIGYIKVPDKRFDPELLPYIGQFIDDAKKRGVKITQASKEKLRQVVYVDAFSIDDESTDAVASCNRYYSQVTTLSGPKELNWMTIEVHKERHKSLVGEGKGRLIRLRELVYHELFHCFLNKGHLPDGYDGIMRPALSNRNPDKFDNWEGMVNDMFSPEYLAIIPDIRK